MYLHVSVPSQLACADFYDFFVKFTPKIVELSDTASASEQEGNGPSAELLVSKLVRHFKWLQDAYVLKGKPVAAESKASEGEESKHSESSPAAAAASSSSSSTAAAAASPSPRVVYILKKAQLICGDLYSRFHDDASLAHLFHFHDVARMTAFSDNVLPAVLRAKGVLVYDDALAKIVDAGQKLKDREMEASIRAAAIVACDRIVEQYNQKLVEMGAPAPSTSAASSDSSSAASTSSAGLTCVSLDYHLWLLGKKPEFRSIQRHATHSGFY
jgi:hypothetical protein